MSTSAVRLGQLVKPPVAVFGIEGRYAHALYSAATKSKKLDTVDADLKKVEKFMDGDSKFSAFVMDPSLKRQQKKGTPRCESAGQVVIKLRRVLATVFM